MKKLTKFFQTSRTNKLIAIFVVVVILAVSYVILRTSAAGFFAAFEVEQGTVNNPAQVINDSNASGGQAVKFGSETPPSSSCALPNYPDANCTGVPAGFSLTTVNGDMNITTAGAIIEGKNINGCVTVNASNVTIRKSKITCSGTAINNCPNDPNCPNTGTLIEDTEVSCNNTQGTGISTLNYTARRVNVHSCENVLHAENNVLIEDSYIHDPINYNPATDPHTDGIQVPEGTSNVTIRHNRIYGNYESSSSFGNAAITAARPITNILITNNLLAGGGYTLYCPEEYLGHYGTNVRVIDNHFSTIFTPGVGGHGPATGCGNEIHSGNVYHETGQPVPF